MTNMDKVFLESNPYYAGFEEIFIKTNDNVKLHVLHKGNSEVPLVMLHGFSLSARELSLNAPRLAENYSVYVLEQRVTVGQIIQNSGPEFPDWRLI